ncbi:unnamed protein product [Penicillium glandicola]
MAWFPYNVPPNASGTPGDDQRAGDLYYPYENSAHPHPPSLAAEPSMFSENHPLYNTSMQHPSAPVHPNYPMIFASAHTDFNSLNHNPVYQPSFENNRPSELLTVGYLSSGQSTACTTPSGSGPSTPAMQEVPNPSVSRLDVQTITGGSRARRRRQEDPHATYQCNWKDCKYTGVFSRKGVLMRHIETQHVTPHSFDCPMCGKLFSRRDNMTEHLGKVHYERFQ